MGHDRCIVWRDSAYDAGFIRLRVEEIGHSQAQIPEAEISVMSSGSVVRRRVLLGLGVVFNFLLPWAAYRLSEPHVGETRGIMISAAAPMLWSLVQFARSRKVDVMSVLVLSGIALSLVVIALGGSPKVLLFRGSLITGFAGLVLLGSAMIRRPLMYVLMMPLVRALTGPQSALATMFSSTVVERARAEWNAFAETPRFRRVMTAMTIVLGLVFVAETVARAALIVLLPTERVLLVAPLVQWGASGVLLLWTFLYFVPAVRQGSGAE